MTFLIGFDQTAAIYTPDETDGSYTVLAKSGLVCRLVHVNTSQSKPADERAEVAHKRRLMWVPDYEMPANAEFVVDGQRWSVQPETVEAIRGISSAVEYRRCTAVAVL